MGRQAGPPSPGAARAGRAAPTRRPDPDPPPSRPDPPSGPRRPTHRRPGPPGPPRQPYPACEPRPLPARDRPCSRRDRFHPGGHPRRYRWSWTTSIWPTWSSGGARSVSERPPSPPCGLVQTWRSSPSLSRRQAWRPGPGFYCLTRHAEVVEASRHPELFCSGKGTNIGDLPPEFLEFFGSMINLDDPRHARFRRIVSRAFTPRFLESLKADVSQIASEIVAGIAPRGQGDFMTEVAALLPLRVIVDLMGIPRQRGEVHLRSDQRHPRIHRPRVRSHRPAREGDRRPAHRRRRVGRGGARDRRGPGAPPRATTSPRRW